MPNCGGCIDGKHISIVQPPNTGALYYNYKNFYSVVLMAVVKSNYEFLFVDVGKQGRMSDGGVITETIFYKKMIDGSLNLPNNENNDENLNFSFICDEAFALHEHVLKPYPQKSLTNEKRIYNYRISRARNVVENAFGLITSVFRILHTPINLPPQKVNIIVMAICVLHNFLRRHSSHYANNLTFDVENSTSHDIKPGSWRQDASQIMTPLQNGSNKNATIDAKENRNKYMEFFNGIGQVSWQEEMISKGKA